MTPELNEAERRLAEKHIQRMEKFASSWPRMRWMTVIVTAFGLGAGIYGLYSSWAIGHRNVLRTVLDSGTNFDKFDMYFMCQSTYMAMWVYVLGFFFLMMSIFLLTHTLVRWNSHHTKRLMAKMLRHQLEEWSATTVGAQARD